MNPERPRSQEVTNLVEKRAQKYPEALIKLPLSEQLPPELREVGERLAHISGTWNPVELVTAGNMREEREKVIEAYLTGQEYNPIFTYPNIDGFEEGNSYQELTTLYNQLRKFEPDNRLGKIGRVGLGYKIRDDLATLEIVRGIKAKDDTLVKEGMNRKFSSLEEAQWVAAQQDFDRRTRTPGLDADGDIDSEAEGGILTKEEKKYLKEKEVDAEEIKKAMEWALSQYGILYDEKTNPTGYKVMIDAATTSIDVRDKSIHGKVVLIPQDKSVRLSKLLPLMNHEIGSHAVQSTNAERLFGLGGGALKVDDDSWYEGLAIRRDNELNKKLYGREGAAGLPYATYAVRMAEEGKSFFDVFKAMFDMRLRSILNKPQEEPQPTLGDVADEKKRRKHLENAFTSTYRAFRGHIDTSNKEAYAMRKDLAYLGGLIKDNDLQQAGFGHFNEAVAVQEGGLQLLAEFALDPKDLPIQFQDLATKYWEEVLKPQMLSEQAKTQTPLQ